MPLLARLIRGCGCSFLLQVHPDEIRVFGQLVFGDAHCQQFVQDTRVNVVERVILGRCGRIDGNLLRRND